MRAEFRAGLVVLREEAAQMIRDAEYWNKTRTDAQPIDCGAERVLLRLFDQCIEAFDADDLDEAKRIWDRIHEQALRSAKG